MPDVDTLTDDVLAVLKAARLERASILATYESTILASLFAATYPERTRLLILVDPQVTHLPREKTPWMPSLTRRQEQIQAVRDTWGTLDWWDAPTGPEREWFARYARGSVTPGGLAAELTSYLHTDIRAVLPTIQVPTLDSSSRSARRRRRSTASWRPSSSPTSSNRRRAPPSSVTAVGAT